MCNFCDANWYIENRNKIKYYLALFIHPFEHSVKWAVFGQITSKWMLNIESLIFITFSLSNLIFVIFFFFFLPFICRKIYRKAISLRDGNSSGTNGNVLLRDGSTDPLAMNPHTISADEVQSTFKLYYWKFTSFFFFTFTILCVQKIKQQMDHWNSHRYFFLTKKKQKFSPNTERWKKKRLQTNLTELAIRCNWPFQLCGAFNSVTESKFNWCFKFLDCNIIIWNYTECKSVWVK